MNTFHKNYQILFPTLQRPLDAVMLVDEDHLNRTNSPAMSATELTRKARQLKSLANVFGAHTCCVALVSEGDQAAQKTFEAQGYETITVNGNRKQVVADLTQTILRQAEQGTLRQVIVVSQDTTFKPFCASAASHVSLAVWLPGGEIPADLADVSFTARPLSEVLPSEKSARVDIRIDFENLIFGLENLGLKLLPADINRLVRLATADLGEISALTAYADWRIIREHTKIDYQDELEALGIRTRYQKSMRGKNSADMEIANDIRTLVEKDSTDTPSVIVLVSHDRDFRPSLETARSRGKKVVLLVLPAGLSQELRSVADEIRYLIPEVSPKLNTRSTGQAEISPWDDLTCVVAHIDQYMLRHNQYLVNPNQLTQFLHTLPNTKNVQEYVKAGILVPAGSSQNGLKLNADHPIVEGIRFLREWVIQRIGYALGPRNLPYVDTNYLYKGMQMDNQLESMGIGVSRSEVANWLELLHRSGWLAKRVIQHPNDPQKMITCWMVKP